MQHEPVVHGGVKYYRVPSGKWIGKKQGRTVCLHRALWEEAYGPIPPVHYVRHRDGNRDNNCLENLVLVDGRARECREFKGRRYYRLPDGHWTSPQPQPTIQLQRAVWKDAHGPIPEGYHIHHIDHDPGNNDIENLVAVLASAHQARYHQEQRPRGENSHFARLTEVQVVEIRASYVKGRNGGIDALAAHYGVSRGCIHHVVHGDRWEHLPHIEPPLATYCPNGHEYTPENTYLYPSGVRSCRICCRRGQRDWLARKREKKTSGP